MDIKKLDNTYYLVLDYTNAYKLFDGSNIELCILHDDYSETVIESKEQLKDAILEDEMIITYLGE